MMKKRPVAPVTLPPPHVRTISYTELPQDTAAGPPPIEWSYSLGGGRRKTVFAYSIYPLRHRESKGKLKMAPHRQDLIFSLRREPGNNDWDLSRITLSFPYGKPSNLRATLMDHYDGPGATMVTDFRFNVAATISKDRYGERFNLTIVPRARILIVRTIHNLSVLLSGMRATDYSQ
jgi:hypothetical protein